MFFDPDEFIPSVQSTKIAVLGDFLIGEWAEAQMIRDGNLLEWKTTPQRRGVSGATRVAKFLADMGFQVSVAGIVNEDEHFIEMQEQLFVSKVDVSGLKTGLKLKPSFANHYYLSASEKNLDVYSGSGEHAFDFKFYRDVIVRALDGASACVIVDTPFETISKESLLAIIQEAHARKVLTCSLVSATSDFEHDLRYFQSQWLVGDQYQISSFLKSCKLNDRKFSTNELQRLSDLISSGGGVLMFSDNFGASSTGEKQIEEMPIDWTLAGAVFAAVLSMGYSRAQAFSIACKCMVGIDPTDLIKHVGQISTH